MDVDDAPGVARDERGPEDAHEAGQHDDIRRKAVDHTRQRGIEGFAPFMLTVIDHRRRNAARLRERQPGGILLVADHRGDARRPAFAGAGADDGLHVGAATADQDDDVLHDGARV